MVNGRIHSIETLGLVDGPGIRVVVFMQGCKLRCAYCHNPDTWNTTGGQEITTVELIKKVKRYKAYFKNSGGGVTLSGGDPLLQPEFAADFFRRCKEEGIHTALDTSGYGLGEYDEILKYTDLVILDIKHIEDNGHKSLTGQGRHGFFQFLDAVKENNKKLWIRHVVVPGITDAREHIIKLAEYIITIPNVEKIELLPYHTYGVDKYRAISIPYRLDGTPPMDPEKMKELNEVLQANLKRKRRSINALSANAGALDINN